MVWLAFAFLSAIAFGLYFVFIKVSSLHMHPIVGAFTLQIAAALLGLFVYCALKFGTAEKIVITSQGLIWAVIAGICVGAAEIFFFFMFKAGGNLAIGSSLVNVVAVLLAVVIGILALGESIAPIKVVGVVLALLGIAILTY